MRLSRRASHASRVLRRIEEVGRSNSPRSHTAPKWKPIVPLREESLPCQRVMSPCPSPGASSNPDWLRARNSFGLGIVLRSCFFASLDQPHFIAT